jgi:hypothetical protein
LFALALYHFNPNKSRSAEAFFSASAVDVVEPDTSTRRCGVFSTTDIAEPSILLN